MYHCSATWWIRVLEVTCVPFTDFYLPRKRRESRTLWSPLDQFRSRSTPKACRQPRLEFLNKWLQNRIDQGKLLVAIAHRICQQSLLLKAGHFAIKSANLYQKLINLTFLIGPQKNWNYTHSIENSKLYISVYWFWMKHRCGNEGAKSPHKWRTCI